MSASVSEVRTGLASNRIFADLVAGVICGFLAVVLSIGHGSLLFSSNLRTYLPVAMGLALFSTTIMAAVAALTSSIRGVVANAQEIPIISLTPVVAAVAAAVPAGMAAEVRVTTVLVAVAISTMAAGLAALTLGYFRLGNLIRFAPYPVVGGFLAGTGWLIMIGGLELVVNERVTFDLIWQLDDPGMLVKLGFAVAVVAALFVGERRGSTAVVPAIILAALVVFHIGTAVMGTTTGSLRAAGWLVSLPESGRLWPPISPADIALVDWRAIAAGIFAMPPVIILTITALLMNSTGIELHSQRDVDLDRELKSVGTMNLLAGAGMGLPGYHSISMTVLSSRLGASSQLVPVIVSLLTAAALVFGNIVLDAVPTVILGGVLIWLGSSVVINWLFRSYRKLELREYLVIVLIFFLITGIDFVLGVVVGMIAAVVLFVFEYGRLDIVRHEMTGKGYQSSVETTEERKKALDQYGDAILIIRLQGYLFFGTADRLRRRIQQRIATREGRQVRFLIIDFRRVNGLDSSSVLSFERLQQIAAREDFVIALTGMSDTTRRALLRGMGPPDGQHVRLESDLERGLKWCEDALLARVMPDLLGHKRWQLVDLLGGIVEDEDTAEKIAPYFSRIDAPSGTRLIEQGTPSDDILVIESGHAAIEITAGQGQQPIRLATAGPGAIVGEIAFYTGEQRSASITAEETVVAWRFSRQDLRRLRSEMPEAASRLHESIAAMLARRLAQTNRLVRLLAD